MIIYLKDEFFVALHLIRLLMKGYALPSSVPSDFIARVQSSAVRSFFALFFFSCL